MTGNEPPSPRPSQLPPLPSSPSFSYASTANRLSQFNIPPPPPPPPPHAVLTKADLANSQAAYADLLSSAKAYRLALAALSTAASAFGSALESCARLKEARAELVTDPTNNTCGASAATAVARESPPPLDLNNSSNNTNTAPRGNCTADTLLAAAGLQHLVANHQHILSETVYRAFEVPLLQDLDRWRAAVEDEEERHARAVEELSREIRRLEKDGVKMMKQQQFRLPQPATALLQQLQRGRGMAAAAAALTPPRRNVGQLREHLVALTARLDGLTALHGDHAAALLRESQEASARIVDASCSLVRAEVDIFESLARKGWSGGGLEDLLERGVDLFAADEDAAIIGSTLSGKGAFIPGGGVGVSAGTGGIGSNGGSGGGGKGSSGGGGTADGAGSGAAMVVGPGSAEGGTKLFSILPPKSILADDISGADPVQGEGGGGEGEGGKTSRSDSLLGDADRYQSLAEAVSSTSDFPPQPLKLNPEDLLEDIEDHRARAAESSSAGPGGPRTQDSDDDGDDEDDDNDEDDEDGDDDDDDSDDEVDEQHQHQHQHRRQQHGGGRTPAKDLYRDADDEEVSPWRDEGLRRQSSDSSVRVRVGSRLGSPHYLRDETWDDA
ncbi:hypothetical protein VTH82DRAFT_7633 [Thermothelomyces myriococcoides]